MISSLNICSFRERYLDESTLFDSDKDLELFVLLVFMVVFVRFVVVFVLASFDRFKINAGSLSLQTTISISWSTLYCFKILSMAILLIPITFLP